MCGGSARRAARRARCSFVTRWRPDSGGQGRCSPPSNAACGPTSCAWGRGSPAGTWPCRPPWRREEESAPSWASGEVFGAFLGADLGPETFYHGHSYGGNALAAAVALEHLRLIEKWDVLGNVRARADQLSSLLGERVAGRVEVREVRQRGLMVGVELDPPAPGLRWGRRVCAGAVSRGVLLRPLGDVVVLMPPLTTTAEEIVRIVEALDGGLDDLAVSGAGATSTSTST